MAGLEGWLEGRRKVRAISLLRDHSKMTTAAVEQLSRCIDFAKARKREELLKGFSILENKEKEADATRRQIIGELAKGELPVEEREGLMRLGRQIDWVADWAHEAGRILLEFDLSDMPEEIRTVAVEMCERVKDCTIRLDDCTEKLMDGKLAESLNAADQVESLEEGVDTLYQKARGLINKLDDGVARVGSIILLSEFMDAVENIADRCEDTCDQVRVIAVTMSKLKS